MQLRAFKTELDPTAAQCAALARHVGCSRRAYNWALERWHALSGLTRLVAFLRACDGRDDAAAAVAYRLGAYLHALHEGEPVIVVRQRKLKKDEAQPDDLFWLTVLLRWLDGREIHIRRKGGTRIDDKSYGWEVSAVYRACWPEPRRDDEPTHQAIHKQLTAEKNREGSPVAWLSEVSASAVREAVGDVGLAYEAFFRRLKKHAKGDHSECKPRRRGKGCKLGEPRWRKEVSRSWHADQPDALRVTESEIKIPGVGWVRLKEQGYVPSTRHLEREALTEEITALKRRLKTAAEEDVGSLKMRIEEKTKQRAAMKAHHLIGGGKMCGLGCSEHGGRWYISVRCEVPDTPSPRVPGLVVGVDSGVRYLATTSPLDQEQRARALRALPADMRPHVSDTDGVLRFAGLEDDPKLNKLQRRRKLWERRMAKRWRSHTKLGLPEHPRSAVIKAQSKGWHEARREVAKYHRRIVEVRDDRVGKAVAAIVATGAERVVVRGQPVNQMLARAKDGGAADRTRNVLAPRVHRARMGDLASRLEYNKMQWAGGECVRAPADYPSTRRCHVCGFVRESDPGYPSWTCECGHVHDRELNAAINLRDYRPSSDEPVDPGRSDQGKLPEAAE